MASLRHDQLGYQPRTTYLTATEAHSPTNVTAKQVWSLLQPAIPDCLKEVKPGVYEACWWKPVPMMDVEILLRTQDIQIEAQPYEPARLPNGLAIRFSLVNDRN